MSSLFSNIDEITHKELIAEGFEMTYQWGNPQNWGVGTKHYVKFLKVVKRNGISEMIEVIFFPETFEGYTHLKAERDDQNKFPDYVYRPKQRLFITPTLDHSSLPDICFNTPVSNMMILKLLIDKYKKSI